MKRPSRLWRSPYVRKPALHVRILSHLFEPLCPSSIKAPAPRAISHTVCKPQDCHLLDKLFHSLPIPSLILLVRYSANKLLEPQSPGGRSETFLCSITCKCVTLATNLTRTAVTTLPHGRPDRQNRRTKCFGSSHAGTADH
jgi:hypothetical protein